MDEATAPPSPTPTPPTAARNGSRVVAGGLLAALLLMAAAALGLVMLGSVTDSQRRVTHTVEVQLQAERVRTDLRGLGRAALDALASTSGRSPEWASRERQTRANLARLRALVEDNPGQAARAGQLAQALEGHISFLQQLHANDPAVLAERRERAEAIEAQIGAFVEQEALLLKQRQQQLATSTRWQAMAIVVLGLLALMALLATMAMWQRLAQQRVRSQVAAQRSADIERARRQLEGLARQLLTTEENERSALARELHDDFGQRLAALKMNVQLAQSLAPQPLPMLGDAVAIADDCIARVRHRAFSLRPAPLDELGLEAALRSHVQEQARLAGVQSTVHVALGDWAPGADWSSHAFRIVQEAVRNAIVHGRPQRLAVSMVNADGHCTLKIEDDGVGLAAGAAGHERPAGQPAGMGVLNMRERCELMGGRFQIGPAAPQGTLVQCTWAAA